MMRSFFFFNWSGLRSQRTNSNGPELVNKSHVDANVVRLLVVEFMWEDNKSLSFSTVHHGASSAYFHVGADQTL